MPLIGHPDILGIIIGEPRQRLSHQPDLVMVETNEPADAENRPGAEDDRARSGKGPDLASVVSHMAIAMIVNAVSRQDIKSIKDCRSVELPNQG